MCAFCAELPHLNSFRCRLIVRSKKSNESGMRNTSCVRNDYLTEQEKIQKLSNQQKKLDSNESTIFLLSRENLRLKLRTRTLRDKLSEYAKRGSMKSVCSQLEKAAHLGMLEDKTVLKDLLESTAANFHKHANGKRYKASLREFYEVIMYWGGPRLASFIGINLFGPEIHSVYRWRNKKGVQLEFGMAKRNFEVLAKVYKEAMQSIGLCKIPVEAAEDETAIVQEVSYLQERDVLTGFCGAVGADHMCSDDFNIKIGEGEEGYNAITDAFSKNKIGNYARVILINPLHPALPKLPAMIMPSCNCFDHKFVNDQWRELSDYYDAYIKPVMGPLLGFASDGESRRRKLFIEYASSSDGLRFQPIPRNLGFIYTAAKKSFGDSYTIEKLCDSDYIHCHKKLINHLDHESRIMTMGNQRVHLNHIQLVYDTFPATQHGLSKCDVDRTDKQNWNSAQRITFSVVRDCLQDLVDGKIGRKDDTVKGTHLFLTIVWLYVEIFCSCTADLKTRVKYAGTVCHVLTIWRNWIRNHENLELKRNFISSQTYTDVLLSCQFAVSLICYMRDNFPELPCDLLGSGSDCVESFWSSNGQWVGNHHNYTFGTLFRNHAHQIRLEQIRVDPKGPKFSKPHPKGESIWHKQLQPGFTSADLKSYPTEGEEISAWKDGIRQARSLAKMIGMNPTENNATYDANGNGCADEDIWFFRPFDEHCHVDEPEEQTDDINHAENIDERNEPENNTTFRGKFVFGNYFLYIICLY